MNCVWTKRAQLEYKKVIKYIFEEYGEMAALKFISSVEHLDTNLYKYPFGRIKKKMYICKK